MKVVVVVVVVRSAGVPVDNKNQTKGTGIVLEGIPSVPVNSPGQGKATSDVLPSPHPIFGQRKERWKALQQGGFFGCARKVPGLPADCGRYGAR